MQVEYTAITSSREGRYWTLIMEIVGFALHLDYDKRGIKVRLGYEDREAGQ